MDYLSLISGTDNLRKFFVLLGISLCCFAFIFSIQKNAELQEKRIKLGEQKQSDSTAMINIEKRVKVAEILVSNVGVKLTKLTCMRDSLLKLKLNESEKFKLTFIQAEINALKLKEETSVNNIVERLQTIEASSIHSSALSQEINNLDSFISTYNIFFWTALIVGLTLIIIGFCKWSRNQKTNDEFKEIELKIKKEELKKLEKENS